METLENLSYNSRIRQLRILAEAALTHYNIGSARVALLSHRSDSMFRVTVAPRPGFANNGVQYKTDDTRFALRLSNPTHTSIEELRSELIWLTVIRQETDLIVPEPVAARNGSLVTEIAVEDIPEMRRAVLFHWVEGRFVDSGLSPTLFERVGTFLARLHQHSRTFVPPDNFIRRRWDWNWLLGEWTIFDPDFVTKKCDGLVGSNEQRILTDAAERIREEMHAIPPNSTNYGLVHFDFHQTNYLFYKSAVHAIDFNDCCWNYYLFDMAITLSGVAGRPNEKSLRQAFFQGYTQIQELPANYEQQLQVFTALRIIKRLNYLFRSGTPQMRSEAPAWLEYAMGWLSQFAGVNINK